VVIKLLMKTTDFGLPAEMWQTTGEEEFLRDFEKRASKMNCRIDEDWDWGNVSNLGMSLMPYANERGK